MTQTDRSPQLHAIKSALSKPGLLNVRCQDSAEAELLHTCLTPEEQRRVAFSWVHDADNLLWRANHPPARFVKGWRS